MSERLYRYWRVPADAESVLSFLRQRLDCRDITYEDHSSHKRIAELEAKLDRRAEAVRIAYTQILPDIEKTERGLEERDQRIAALEAELRDIDQELDDHDALDARLAKEGRQPSDRVDRIAGKCTGLKRSLATSKRRGAQRDALLEAVDWLLASGDHQREIKVPEGVMVFGEDAAEKLRLVADRVKPVWKAEGMEQ